MSLIIVLQKAITMISMNLHTLLRAAVSAASRNHALCKCLLRDLSGSELETPELNQLLRNIFDVCICLNVYLYQLINRKNIKAIKCRKF